MARRQLTTLQYSAGVQSTAILEMILCGMIPRPENFLVVNADPGLENSLTYPHVASMKTRCEAAGIDFVTATGPKLSHDLRTLKESGKTRLDNPPFWTPSTRGRKEGHLVQKCTQAYKVAPMDRAIPNVPEMLTAVQDMAAATGPAERIHRPRGGYLPEELAGCCARPGATRKECQWQAGGKTYCRCPCHGHQEEENANL